MQKAPVAKRAEGLKGNGGLADYKGGLSFKFATKNGNQSGCTLELPGSSKPDQENVHFSEYL